MKSETARKREPSDEYDRVKASYDNISALQAV
jgi:hypothetical protein